MKNKHVIIVIILSALLTSAIFMSGAAVAASQRVPVKVAEVVRGNIQITQMVNGIIEPTKNINVSAKIGGFVQEVRVKVGQYVKAGEVLVIFERDQVLAQMKQAEAALEMAKANLSQVLKGASEEDKKQVQAAYDQAVISYEAALKNVNFAESMFNDRTMQQQQLNGAKLQVESSEKQLQMAVERLNQTQIAYDLAKADFERMTSLYKSQVITQKQYEAVEVQFKNAESALVSAQLAKEQAEIGYNGAKESYTLVEDIYSNRRTAEQQLEGAKTQLEMAKVSVRVAETNLQKITKGATPEQIQVSKASVKQAEAALDLVKIQLENSTIKSPTAGVIAQLNADPGEMVGPGVPVIILIDLDRVYVKADVTADVLKSIDLGDGVDVRVRNFTGSRQGQIDIISPMADPRTQAFPIKVLLENKDRQLRAGMFADLNLVLQKSMSTLIVPIEAVQNLQSGPFVFVVKDGKASKRSIQVGIVNERQVEVTKGVQPGEKIAIKGQFTLKDGDLVEVIQ